jgi:hypothetical protein
MSDDEFPASREGSCNDAGYSGVWNRRWTRRWPPSRFQAVAPISGATGNNEKAAHGLPFLRKWLPPSAGSKRGRLRARDRGPDGDPPNLRVIWEWTAKGSSGGGELVDGIARSNGKRGREPFLDLTASLEYIALPDAETSTCSARWNRLPCAKPRERTNRTVSQAGGLRRVRADYDFGHNTPSDSALGILSYADALAHGCLAERGR